MNLTDKEETARPLVEADRSSSEHLRALQEMLRAGIINEVEFETIQKRILGTWPNFPA